MKRNWKKEEEEKEKERKSCWDDEWTQMSSSLSYNPTFCIKPPPISSNSNSRQMNGHLNQFTSNGINTFMEVNVLLKIYVWVSRVSVFDEIRVISYLRKSPYITQFGLKPFLIHSEPSLFFSLSSIWPLEPNSISI